MQIDANTGIVTDVGTTTWRLLWSKYLYWSIIILIVASISLVIHPFISLFIFAIYVGYVWKKVSTIFMQQFAMVNNMSYEQSAALDTFTGRLFEIGHSRYPANVVSGVYRNHSMRLFNYYYSVGGGRSKRTFRFTGFELFFEKTFFPYILLRSNSMPKHAVTDTNGETVDTKIFLEDEFKKDFSLYTTKGYETEVFQIFTKEVLKFLQECAMCYSIEFSGNKMYVYDNVTISKKIQLDEMYMVVKKIFDIIGPLLNRLHDDFAVLHPYYNKD